MGICNLRHVDKEIMKRKSSGTIQSNLIDIKGIKLPEEQKGVKSNYAYFPIIFDGYKKTRDEVYEELKSII